MTDPGQPGAAPADPAGADTPRDPPATEQPATEQPGPGHPPPPAADQALPAAETTGAAEAAPDPATGPAGPLAGGDRPAAPPAVRRPRTRRRIVLGAAMAGGGLGLVLVLVFAGWVLLSYEPPQSVQAPSPDGGGTGSDVQMIPGTLTIRDGSQEPPTIRFQPSSILDFGVAPAPAPGETATAIRHSLDIVHVAGRAAPLVFGNPAIVAESGTPAGAALPVVNDLATDCFREPRTGTPAIPYCTIHLEWQPAGTAAFAATLAVSYRPAGAAAADGDPVLRIPLRGAVSARPDRPDIAAEPAVLDFGTDRPAETPHRGTLVLSVATAAATVTEIRTTEPETLAVDPGTDCRRSYIPAVGAPDACTLAVSWTPRRGDLLDAALVVTWRPDPPVPGELPRQLRIPVAGAARATRPDLVPDPPTIAFNGTDPGTLTLLARDAPVVVESLQAAAAHLDFTERPVLDPDACVTRIEPGQTCTLAIDWSAPAATRRDAELTIVYVINAERRTRTLPLALRAPARPPPALPAAPDPALQARAVILDDITRRRQVPVLAHGIGIVRNDPLASPKAADAAPPPQYVDDDYSRIGLDPEASTRPVWLASAILRGTPVPAVLAATIDAKLPSPVTATVQRDIHAAHGRSVIIPRGSRVIGSTRAPEGGDAAAVVQGMLTARAGRIQIDWERIIRPDGTAFMIRDNMATQDLMGRSGVLGHIDVREVERYLSLLVSHGVDAATILALDSNETLTTNQTVDPSTGRPLVTATQTLTPEQQARTALADAVREIAVQIASHVLPPPTLTVPRGTRIVLIPTTDLWLRPYRGHLAPAPRARARRPDPGTTRPDRRRTRCRPLHRQAPHRRRAGRPRAAEPTLGHPGAPAARAPVRRHPDGPRPDSGRRTAPGHPQPAGRGAGGAPPHPAARPRLAAAATVIGPAFSHRPTDVLSVLLKPLSRHYLHPDVEEIAVCAPHMLFLRTRTPDRLGRVWRPLPDPALTHDYLDTAVHAVANVYTLPYDGDRSPILYGTVPGGHRMTAATGPNVVHDEPTPEGGIALCIRQLDRTSQRRLEDWNIRPGAALDRSHAGPLRRVSSRQHTGAYDAIFDAARAGAPVLVSGSQSTGKTSLLNLLLSEIDEHLRVIAVEDVRELTIRNPNRLHVIIPRNRHTETGRGVIDPRSNVDLVNRMTPDIVVIGEISTYNAAMALELMRGGNTHFWTSIHAKSTDEAPYAFADRVRHEQPDVDPEAVADTIRRHMTIIQLVRTGSRRRIVDVRTPAGPEPPAPAEPVSARP